MPSETPFFKSPTNIIRDQSLQCVNQFQAAIKEQKDIVEVKFPEYKILTAVPALTTQVSTCCVFILYFEDKPTYVFGHFNSILYTSKENIYLTIPFLPYGGHYKKKGWIKVNAKLL